MYKRSLLFCFIVIFILIINIPNSQAEVSLIQLTDNNFHDYHPQINENNYVVWVSEHGDDNVLFSWDGRKIKEVTSINYYDCLQINNNNFVVWQGFDGNDFEIFLYDGANTSQITDNDFDDFHPQINNNNYIVWHSNQGIFLYDGNNVNKITTNAKSPFINDNNYIVWQGFDGNDFEIFLNDGANTSQITDNDFDDFHPQINNNNYIVWFGGLAYKDLNEHLIIFLYDGNISSELTDNKINECYPLINDNNYLIWLRGMNGIYQYDGSNISKITGNRWDQGDYALNNNNYVIWNEFDGNDIEILLYDGANTSQITDNDFDDFHPQINNNNYIVWTGFWNNRTQDTEIFLYGIDLDYKSYLPNITKNYFGWSTPFVVQNIGTGESVVQSKFIDTNGLEVVSKTDLGLKTMSSRSINLKTMTSPGKSFKGNSVIYSNQPVATVVNEHSPYSSMAYEGVMTTNATSKVHLPNITRNYYGWTTPFIVQNVDTDDTTVEVKFYRKGHSSPVLTLNRTIKPAESKSINPSLYPVLGTSFQGSVVVESTNGKKIAAVVNEHKGKGKAMSYNGLSQGQDTVFLPNITRGYFGWTTSFIIQNTGAEATTLTVEYYKRGENTPVYTQNLPSIAPRTTKSINQRDIKALGVFCGSAVVKAETGKEIVAIVNEHSGDDNMAYSGITEGNTTNYLPNITRDYFDWSTPFTVQNLDTTEADIEIKFYQKGASTPAHTLSYTNISPGSAVTINPAFLKTLGTFQGSVVVTSTNDKQIATVVNEHHKSGQAMSYNGQ